MTRPKNEAQRDQLLAAIRAADLPLSTDQAAATLPPYTVTHECRGYLCRKTDAMSAVVSISCNGLTHIKTLHRHGTYAYPHLRILEQRGLIVRVRFENDRRVFWQAADAAPVSVDELNAMWSA